VRGKHHHPVDHGRDEEDGHQDLPADVADGRELAEGVEAEDDQGAEDQAAGPTGVEDVQPVGLGPGKSVAVSGLMTDSQAPLRAKR